MINKSVLLHCPPERAFRLCTAHISEWWPKTHRLTKDPESELFLEEGGRFAERATDGREVPLGRVTLWAPPDRLMLDFYMGTGEDRPTAVEVTFTAEGEGTRVTVHHRATAASVEIWDQRAPVFERSWEAVLGALAGW